MRRTSSLGIALVCVFIATGMLTAAAGAKERTSLSSWVGQLLRLKKSEPVETKVEPPAVHTAVHTAGPQARPQPQTQVPPPVWWSQTTATSRQAPRAPEAPRSPEATPDLLLNPPSPPAVDQAWVQLPVHQHERDYTTEEILALTRRTAANASSRRVAQTRNSGDSLREEIDFKPAKSPAFATANHSVNANFPRNGVLQVNHVAELGELPLGSVPLVGSRPRESVPVERVPREIQPRENQPLEIQPREIQPLASVERVPREIQPHENQPRENQPLDSVLIGNTPAEVRQSASDEPLAVEPAAPARPIEFAPIPTERSSTGPTLPPVFEKVRGRIAAIEAKTGVIRIDLVENVSLPAGTKIRVYHDTETGDGATVHLRVVESIAGVAAARLIDGAALDSISTGDKIIAWRTADVK